MSAEVALSTVAPRKEIAKLRLVEARRTEVILAVREATGNTIIAPPLAPLLAHGGLPEERLGAELLRCVGEGAVVTPTPMTRLEVAHLGAVQLPIERPSLCP